MSNTFKAIAYSYASTESQPFLFDAFCVEDGRVTLDIHQRFVSKEEFLEAIEGAINLLPAPPVEEVSLEEVMAND